MRDTSWKRGLLAGVVTGALVAGVAARMLGSSDAVAPDSSGDLATPRQQSVMAELQADLDEGLRRWYSGDPSGYAELYADELSYFDPGTDVSLDGLDALRTYYEPLVNRFHVDRYETVNVRLQLHGDIAILTFNLNEYETGVPPSAEWKVTHVYRHFGDGWRVIHGHFSQVAAG